MINADDGLGRLLDDLPEWSGTVVTCVKCACRNGPKSKWYYDAITGDEYLERECFLCGYRWHEKCADTAGPSR